MDEATSQRALPKNGSFTGGSGLEPLIPEVTRNPRNTCGFRWEPPRGFEPRTYALRESDTPNPVGFHEGKRFARVPQEAQEESFVLRSVLTAVDLEPGLRTKFLLPRIKRTGCVRR